MIIIDIYKNKDIHDLDGEIWKDIKGYEGLYQVSNLGRVKSFQNHRVFIRKQSHNKKGYLVLVLSKNNKNIQCRVHRLVAEAFLPNPNNYPCINHKDESRTNNTVDNLEWCTVQYNNYYGTRIDKIRKVIAKPVLLTDLDTGISLITLSARESSHMLGVSKHSVSSVANPNTKNKTVKNHTAKYLPKDFEITTKEMNFTDEQKKHLLDSSVGEITL